MPEAKSSAFDAEMMAIALRMAERGLGSTMPNPSVGAVIANEATGEVLARGVTAPSARTGRAHHQAGAPARSKAIRTKA